MPSSGQKSRIIIADDHKLMREGVHELLRAKYHIVAMVENGEQLVEAACRLLPDLMVIDISMPLLNGLDALRQLRTAGVQAKAVMLTLCVNTAYVRRAVQMGALGYVAKVRAKQDLLIALQAAREGRTFLSPEFDPYVYGSPVLSGGGRHHE